MLRWASAEPTWTIVPRFRGSIRWSAAIVPWTVPRYVTSVARRNSSAVRSANLENTVAIALLTPDVDWTQLGFDLLGRSLDRVGVGDVGWDCDPCADLGAGGVETV